MTITQNDIRLLKQSSRAVYAKLDILNRNFKTIGAIDGELISDDYSFDAASDVRKTANIVLHIANSSIDIGNDRKIWFDKYLRLSMGIFDILRGEVVWYNIGLFVYLDVNYSYDASSRQLSISLGDLTCILNGERGGIVSGESVKIEAGSSIRSALISTVTQLGGIRKYRIEDIGKEVPYDLEFSTGSNVQSIIAELRDLYPGWETYFDDDTFVCQPFPTAANDPIVLDDTIMRDLVISESKSTSFKGVYNCIEVWGKCIDTDTYTTDVTYSSGEYRLSNTAVAELTNNCNYGFKANADNTGGVNIKINSFTSLPVLGEGNVPLSPGRIKAGKSYVVRYKQNGSQSYFYFMGEYQICGIAKLMSRQPTNAEIVADIANNPTSNISYVVEPNNPYAADIIGEVRNVLSGGEYDNIYSEDLALARAKYELWLTSDMKDDISLEMIDIPWLQVNQKIEYTSLSTGKKSQYIIKSKHGSTTSGTMTINAVRFQPLYSWL